ncbi:hypothetical protein RR46_14505 [Papilio xuthus]|uniref:Uncharacterized protein n=1 Tax=Papilio xuthus TaxID=66420 RepID=A0A194PCJ0_PAPXU|nr:hypothetical protein RR46_14505 [Papilio xuthus]
MRLYVTFLLLMVAVNGEFDNKRNLIKTENNGLKKRTPALSTVSSPANAGVEYADTKQQLADKSPSQTSGDKQRSMAQLVLITSETNRTAARPGPPRLANMCRSLAPHREYATPAPQFSKFSDLLAGQAPSYQAAIASQLFSPVSVYQPRTGTPTTYEVSAPVPSQLAYSEHFQQPNLQYNSQVYNSKLPTQPEISQQDVLAQTQQIYNQQPLQQAYQQQPAYQQPLQQTYQQPLQQTYQQLPQTIQSQAPQLSYNQISPAQFSAQQYKQLENQPAVQALQYQQSPKAFYSDNQHSLLASQYNLAPQQYYSEGQQQYQQPYVQEQPAQNVQYIQPAVTYRQDDTQQKVYSQSAQSSALERQQFVAQNYQTQPQGPVSFTKISQDQAQSVVHHPLYQQNVQQAPSQGGHENLSYFRPGPQLQIQPQVLAQNQPQSYQPQGNHRHDIVSHYKKLKTQKRNLYKKRYELPLDNNEPVAQFDVASFIQNSANKKLHKLQYGDGKRKEYGKITVIIMTLDHKVDNGCAKYSELGSGYRKFSSNDYMDYENLKNLMDQNSGDDRRDSWTDYLNIEDSDVAKVTEAVKASDELANQKEFDYDFASLAECKKDNSASNQDYQHKNNYHNNVIDYTAIHHPEKKGVLKNFKFPFFFRNKTTTSMTPKKDGKKKTVKRSKVSNFRESVTVDGQNLGLESLYGIELKNVFNKNKRSYNALVMCPACRKKYEDSLKTFPKTRQLSEPILHNCRQYFQNAAAEEKKKVPKIVYSQPEDRFRRQQPEDKERQMKEIEEVARKIESVTVDYPMKKKVTIGTINPTLMK